MPLSYTNRRRRKMKQRNNSSSSDSSPAGLIFLFASMLAGFFLLYLNTTALFRDKRQANGITLYEEQARQKQKVKPGETYWDPKGEGAPEPIFPDFIQNIADKVVNTLKFPNIDSFLPSKKVKPEDFGEYVLIKLSTSKTRKTKFHMCRLAHGAYTRDPVHLPFFSDLLGISRCNGPANILIWTQEEAEEYLSKKRVVPPTGFIFHAGRVGSTLTSNILAVDPTALVYSEAQPIVEASYTYCRTCDMEERVSLFRLVVSLMGVSDTHERLFFKLHPTSTPEIELFQLAFPDTPYIYLHREPVEVMMSMLKKKKPAYDNNYLPRTPAKRPGQKKPKMPKQPPCLRPLKEVHKLLHFTESNHKASREEYCGAYLKVINEAAAKYSSDDTNGMPVCYTKDFVQKMVDVVIPYHFKVEITPEHSARIQEVSGVYSKQRKNKERLGGYRDDTKTKQSGAWKELKQMSNQWVQKNYQKLLDIEKRKTEEYQKQYSNN